MQKTKYRRRSDCGVSTGEKREPKHAFKPLKLRKIEIISFFKSSKKLIIA